MTIRQYERDIAGLLEFYPNGVPTDTPTIQVINPDGTDLHDVTSVTLDTVSTTVGAISKGARTFTVASATGMRTDRRYWLATDGGYGYAVQPVGIDGTTVRTQEPARFDFASGTLIGHGLRYTMTTTETAIGGVNALRNIRAVWRYSINSAVQPAVREVLDIVPHPFAIPVTDADIHSRDPTFGTLSYDYADLARAAEEDIFSKIKAWQQLPSRVEDRRQLTAAAVYYMLQMRAARAEEDGQWEKWGGKFAEEMNHHQQSLLFYDNDDDGILDGSTTNPDGTNVIGGDLRRLATFSPVG